ncbi:hypothetical protein DL96DRAFT_1628327 [Flagelloscypha sp. PMI_526]|nr:hypothetical protein DL96DRAFT_1628327 [Flagelloscypha sp. PMI_526]
MDTLDPMVLQFRRQKAAERQRRKRERDRNRARGVITPPPSSPQASVSVVPITEDEIKKQKTRIAARDRQRKHRRLVRERKLREQGIDVDGTSSTSSYPVDHHFILEHGGSNFHPLQGHVDIHEHLALNSSHTTVTLPDGVARAGGQSFASTLLLSFSCAPLLKQHLLRNLNMTNEELASLEPIIADAWEQWNAQRQMHYQHAVAAHDTVPPERSYSEFRARYQAQQAAQSSSPAAVVEED